MGSFPPVFMLQEQFKPIKLVKISCPRCSELMVKIYPWSSILPTESVKGASAPLCKKCAKKNYEKNYKKLPD